MYMISNCVNIIKSHKVYAGISVLALIVLIVFVNTPSRVARPGWTIVRIEEKEDSEYIASIKEEEIRIVDGITSVPFKFEERTGNMSAEFYVSFDRKHNMSKLQQVQWYYRGIKKASKIPEAKWTPMSESDNLYRLSTIVGRVYRETH